MQFDARHSPVLSINAPEWFGEAEFLQWLNKRDRPLMTWHSIGRDANEWSDIIVFIDPSLSGEGSEDGEMPEKYWQIIVSACQSHFKPSTGFHIIVRITNLCE